MLLLLLACLAPPDGPPDADTAPSEVWTPSYPLDDVLTFADLQALGTHNSYHLRTEGVDRPEWDYDHAPLDGQLGEQGVRQFELDLSWVDDHFEVFHVGILDENTTCRLLADCLATMKRWSDANPGHHPLFTLLEMKDDPDRVDLTAAVWGLEAELARVWPRERLVVPDDVQRGAASLREGLAQGGWPTLGALRGKALFVLHAGGGWSDAYFDGERSSAGRLLFPDVDDLDHPLAAVHTYNDPVGDASRIADAVAAGHLVRTRTDSDGNEARANDTRVRDAALASGAHFVSTDFPIPHPDTGYVVRIPGGTPSRCNPLRAPSVCTSEAIEAPQQLGPDSEE
jgi:hypothetical protein